MRKQLWTKLVAIAMLSVFVVTMIPTSVFALEVRAAMDDYYSIVSEHKYTLAPGIVESDLVFNNVEGSRRQAVHVVEVDINNPYTKVMPSYMGMKENIVAGKYSTATMGDQIAYAEANGYGNVVAAMNLSLSWYSSDYYAEHPEFVGEPLGYLIMDGVKYENSRGQSAGAETCLVINFDEKDGVARPEGMPKAEVRLTTSPVTGWEEQVIPANFGFLAQDGKNLQNKNHTSGFGPKSVVGVKADGTIVMAMCDGRQDPYSSGFNKYEIADYLLSLGCVNVIQGDGGGSSQFYTQRPGEELELHCSPSDGAARPTTHGVLVITTAPATGEFVRATVSSENKFYTPGSKVAFKAVGSDVVGTFAEIPEDAFWQLKDSSMGSIDKNGVFTSNGKVGEATAQLVYNDEVVGEATVEIVVPEIAIKTSKLVLPYGETTEIKFLATTNGGLNTVTLKEGDIELTLSDSAMGTINGTFFTTTSDTSIQGGNLIAVACGDTSTAITVEVTFGKASEIVYDFEDPSKSIIDTSDAGGDSDADTTGNYYYGWHIADKGVTKYYGYRTHSVTTKNNTKYGLGVPCNLKVVNSTSGMVRNGDYAMAVDIDYSQVTSTGATQVCMWLPEALDVSEATSVGVWVYFPDVENLGESMFIAWTGKKSTGKNANVNTGITIGDQFGGKQGFSDEGWYYISIDTKANDMVTLDYLTFMSYETANTQVNPKSHYTFYLDDFTVDYSDAVIDRENPYFTGVYVTESDVEKELTNGQTISSNVVSFFADVTENMDKDNYSGLDYSSLNVTVDGVRVTDGVYVTNNGRISVTDLRLSNGVHTIRIAICDEQGNEGSIVRKIVVNNKKGVVRFELMNPNYAYVPTGSIVYLNLIAENISEIESITTKVRLDGTSKWDLQGMEVAYGFTATWTVNDNNEAWITFTRVSDQVADTEVLAKLPLRAWVSTAYLNPNVAAKYITDSTSKEGKGYILTPKAMWTGGAVTKMHIIADASEGVITYADGSKGTFSSETYEITTEMNKHHSDIVDGFAEHTQGKTSFHIHKAGEKTSKAATCTEAGYTDRVFCVGCTCDTLTVNGNECDTHNGCGAVVEWGETIAPLGHDITVTTDGLYTCGTCGDSYYYIDGVLQKGWFNVHGNDYYCNNVGLAANGKVEIDGRVYTFVDHVLTEGCWEHDGVGLTYWWAGSRINRTLYGTHWVTIGGKQYYFNNCYANTGVSKIQINATSQYTYGVFDENGVFLEDYRGVSEGRFFENGYMLKRYQLVEHDGNYYFITDNDMIAKNVSISLSASHIKGLTFPNGDPIRPGVYKFDAEGKMVVENGLVGDYFYVNGIVQPAYQLIKVDGDYYYIGDYNKIVKNATVYLGEKILEGTPFQAGQFLFDETGKMIIKNGPNAQDGYFYLNGVKQQAYQLIEFGGAYYYIGDSNRYVTNQKVYLNEKTLAGTPFKPGNFMFDESGKMVLKNGPDADGYFYLNGVKQQAYQLIEFEGAYYYISDYHKYVVNQKVYLNEKALAGTPFKPGNFMFDESGKMVLKNGPDADGYFYLNGVKQQAYQLIEFEGAYYYISDYHKYVVNQRVYLNEKALAGTPFKPGNFMFDKNGKMVLKNGPDADGYFYLNGVKQQAYQLIEFEGAYYYISDYHKYVVNQRVYLNEKTLAGTPFKPGNFKFDKNGKMVLKNGPDADGFFYLNGVKQSAYQLIEFDGAYYFISDYHKYVAGKTVYVGAKYLEGTGLKPGNFKFDETGKMVLKNGPAADGYFYLKGVKQSAYQLIEFEGNYYYIGDGNKYVTDQRVYIGAKYLEGTSLEPGNYVFDKDGKMIVNN